MLDPRTYQPTNPFQLYDENRRRNRAHNHSTTSYYDTWEATNTGFWPSKTQTQNEEEELDESGMCSPPLWTTSPPRDDDQIRKRSLSPASRTQAIVRGQRELMEMVRNMPESNYELSLKDLVEHHRVQQEKTVTRVDERSLKKGSVGGSGRRVVKRSGTIDRGSSSSSSSSSSGFYLKMVFPSFSLGSNKNKKNKKKLKRNESSSVNGGCSKVSPRPSVSDGSGKGGGGGGVDKEWWKKSPKESDSGASSSINSGSTKSSGSSSSSNSNSSTSKSRHEKSGGRCWPCIPRLKRQTKK